MPATQSILLRIVAVADRERKREQEESLWCVSDEGVRCILFYFINCYFCCLFLLVPSLLILLRESGYSAGCQLVSLLRDATVSRFNRRVSTHPMLNCHVTFSIKHCERLPAQSVWKKMAKSPIFQTTAASLISPTLPAIASSLALLFLG